MVISKNNPQLECSQECITAIKRSSTIVTGMDESLRAYMEERAIISMFSVLHRRAGRLVRDRATRRRLNPLLRKFVCNLVMYFRDAGKLDDFTLTNIITALSLADNHSEAPYGTIDYSTLIRRPNPINSDSDEFFVVGREGRIEDPGCPMKLLTEQSQKISQIPKEQLKVFLGFYYARNLNPMRGAPKIPVDDFRNLVPNEIRSNPLLEEAFTDVCLSDGAWELFQQKVAA